MNIYVQSKEKERLVADSIPYKTCKNLFIDNPREFIGVADNNTGQHATEEFIADLQAIKNSNHLSLRKL